MDVLRRLHEEICRRYSDESIAAHRASVMPTIYRWRGGMWHERVYLRPSESRPRPGWMA